jgi:hypothetical protein
MINSVPCKVDEMPAQQEHATSPHLFIEFLEVMFYSVCGHIVANSQLQVAFKSYLIHCK